MRHHFLKLLFGTRIQDPLAVNVYRQYYLFYVNHYYNVCLHPWEGAKENWLSMKLMSGTEFLFIYFLTVTFPTALSNSATYRYIKQKKFLKILLTTMKLHMYSTESFKED